MSAAHHRIMVLAVFVVWLMWALWPDLSIAFESPYGRTITCGPIFNNIVHWIEGRPGHYFALFIGIVFALFGWLHRSAVAIGAGLRVGLGLYCVPTVVRWLFQLFQ